jgi:hypothetical protein
MWMAAVTFTLLATVVPTGPDIVDSSQVREDPVASAKAWSQFQAQLAREERGQRLRYDRDHIRAHKAVLATIRRERARYDRARTSRAVEILQATMGSVAAALRRQVQEIDPWGNGSKVGDDYEAIIKMLETDYPAALITAFNGDRSALIERRAALEGRLQKLRGWLAQAAKQGDDEDE